MVSLNNNRVVNSRSDCIRSSCVSAGDPGLDLPSCSLNSDLNANFSLPSKPDDAKDLALQRNLVTFFQRLTKIWVGLR